MGLLGLLIAAAIAWTLLRVWMYRSEAQESREPPPDEDDGQAN